MKHLWLCLVLGVPLAAQEKIAVVGLVHSHVWGHLDRMGIDAAPAVLKAFERVDHRITPPSPLSQHVDGLEVRVARTVQPHAAGGECAQIVWRGRLFDHV